MPHEPLRVAVLNWRDTTHPEGGGSERYVERMAASLADHGCRVEVRCARHRGAPRRQERDGVAFVHAGGRYSVYPRALLALLGARLRGRRPDVVLDVHNGVPFFARLVAGCPVVVLVHHVHREQWGVVFGRRVSRVGWWLESRLSPLVHRGCQYVAVSGVTRAELAGLGVRPEHVAVVHNGSVAPAPVTTPRSPGAALVVLGRLVPHKRVEHALQVLARLSPRVPGLTLTVVGAGWWRERLEEEARRLGVADRVRFTGFLEEPAKEAELARAWVMLAPSVKEGWGLMVVEAAAFEVPTVAYRAAGGLAESVLDGVTGVLVEDLDAMVEETHRLLTDTALRARMGAAARSQATRYSWAEAAAGLEELLRRAADGRPPTDEVGPGRVVDLRALGTPGTMDPAGPAPADVAAQRPPYSSSWPES